MKKGDLSTSALFSLVIVILVAALVIFLIYTWSNEGSDVFRSFINIPTTG